MQEHVVSGEPVQTPPHAPFFPNVLISRTKENWKDWSSFLLPAPFLLSGATKPVSRETLLLTLQRGQETTSAQ